MRSCPSVRRSVSPSIGLSVCPVLSSKVKITHTRRILCRVSGLVVINDGDLQAIASIIVVVVLAVTTLGTMTTITAKNKDSNKKDNNNNANNNNDNHDGQSLSSL